MHLFANLTCRAMQEGFWLQRSGPPRRSGSRWAACAWLCHRNARCAAGLWWSSAGSWQMHLAYVRGSSDFQSPAHNSRGERRVNSLCLSSLSVFVLTELHLGVAAVTDTSLWTNRPLAGDPTLLHCRGPLLWHVRNEPTVDPSAQSQYPPTVALRV